MTASLDVEPPTEPVELGECPHCGGTGIVDDDWYVAEQLVAAEFDCQRCEREGRCPVDAAGVCACDDCERLPADERARTSS